MSAIDNRLFAYALLGSLYRENEENKVKKVKYAASIPIGHRMKQLVGIRESSYLVSVETMKDSIRIELRDKYNTTIPFEKVEIDTFDILE